MFIPQSTDPSQLPQRQIQGRWAEIQGCKNPTPSNMVHIVQELLHTEPEGKKISVGELEAKCD